MNVRRLRVRLFVAVLVAGAALLALPGWTQTPAAAPPLVALTVGGGRQRE